MATELNCIFQGGGAKLVTLMAAAEALEELEKEEVIKVREVAGTSAGSIAAFAFARSEATEIIRHKMKNAANDVIGHFSRKRRTIGILTDIARGKPIFEEKMLEKFLRDTFCQEVSDRITLDDGDIPVHVRVADVRSGQKYTYTQGHGIPFERALVDSCAIPLAFRTHKSGSPYADGGIVSNLANSDIFADPSRRTIAFSFPKSAPYEYDGLLSYLMSLASTAIDNSVSEARTKIEGSGGFIVELSDSFRTFDFEEALKTGLDEKIFKSQKSEARNKIIQALRNFESQQRLLDLERLGRVQDFTNQFFDTVAKKYSYGVTSCAIICIAHGLAKGPDAPEKPDTLIKETLVHALGDEILNFKIGITKGEVHEIGSDVQWEITDSDGDLVKADQEVIQSEFNGQPVWHSCFVLKKPLHKTRCPLSVRLVTSHVGLMRGLLKRQGVEWMKAASHQNDNIEEQDFVLVAPKSAGSFVMVDLLENKHRVAPEPPDFKNMHKSWSAGSRMSEEQLARYVSSTLNLPEHTYTGWRCSDVSPGSSSGVLIERSG